MFTYAQELFISYLTQQTHKKCAHKKDLNYNDLSNFVQEEEKLEFLHQIVPKKITVKEFREILERGSDSDSEDDASSTESDNSDGEEIEDEEDDDEGDDDDEEEEDGGNLHFFLTLLYIECLFIDLFSIFPIYVQKWMVRLAKRVTATMRLSMKIKFYLVYTQLFCTRCHCGT